MLLSPSPLSLSFSLSRCHCNATFRLRNCLRIRRPVYRMRATSASYKFQSRVPVSRLRVIVRFLIILFTRSLEETKCCALTNLIPLKISTLCHIEHCSQIFVGNISASLSIGRCVVYCVILRTIYYSKNEK